jgi:hypothetical protein
MGLRMSMSLARTARDVPVNVAFLPLENLANPLIPNSCTALVRGRSSVQSDRQHHLTPNDSGIHTPFPAPDCGRNCL